MRYTNMLAGLLPFRRSFLPFTRVENPHSRSSIQFLNSFVSIIFIENKTLQRITLNMHHLHLSSQLKSSRASANILSESNFDKQPNSQKNTQYFNQTQQKHQVREKLIIAQEQLHQYIEICQWRASNKEVVIPINKIIVTNINSQLKEVQLQIFRDSYCLRVTDIQLISLAEMIKLLESSVQGFRILQDHFGNFLISEEMFAIDEGKKCRVWVNGKYSENCVDRVGNWEINKSKLVNIMKNICVSAPIAHQFFQQLSNCSNYEEMLELAKRFKQSHKSLLNEEKEPLLKKIPPNKLNFSSKHKKGLLSSQSIHLSRRSISLNETLPQKSSTNPNKESLTTDTSRDCNVEVCQSRHFQFGDSSSVRSSNSSISFEFNQSFRNPFKEIKKNNISLQTNVFNHIISPNFNETPIVQPELKIKKLESFCRVVDEKEESDGQEEIIIMPEQQKIQSEKQEIKEQFEKIIRQNGWSTKLMGLLDNETHVEESLSYGMEQHSYLTNVKLNKLDKLGKEMTISIISNPELEQQF